MGNGDEDVRFLLVGGSKAPPRLAVPVPVGVRLTIGRAAGCWLTLPGDAVEENHTELILQDARLRVKHVGPAGGTWINRARIAEGVLREDDTLVIGPYRLQLGRQGSLPAAQGSDVPDVILEEEQPIEAVDEEEPQAATDEALSRADEQAPKQTLKWAVCIVAIVGALGSLSWWWLAPRFSKEMPTGTVYHCPVDGTVFRGEWRGGPPKCPQCGALCLGTLRYKSEKADGSAAVTTAPSTPASTPTQGIPTKKGRGP